MWKTETWKIDSSVALSFEKEGIYQFVIVNFKNRKKSVMFKNRTNPMGGLPSVKWSRKCYVFSVGWFRYRVLGIFQEKRKKEGKQ